MAIYFYRSKSGDGWRNLATDRYFLENLGADDIMLYYYINENAVIIGRNQNAWKECNLDRMDADGVQLVRRHTGGGAVFHDCGNLNFSFIMGEKNYDVQRQMNVVIAAMKKLGLTAELSGRNDILIDGKKFSGNAFGTSREMCGHHGTLLVSADLSRLANYLNVSEKKIRSKGISSVRARVCNLSDLAAGIDVERTAAALQDTFREEYGDYTEFVIDEATEKKIDAYYEEQCSWEWRLGRTPKFDYEFDERFSFGEMQIQLSLDSAVVCAAKVYTDALDTGIATAVEQKLLGARFDSNALADALDQPDNAYFHEIAEYLRKQVL